METITHPGHPHELELKEASRPYNCNGCDQLGFGLSYVCNKYAGCNYFLHKECVNPQSQIRYPFSKVCVLQFFKGGGSGEKSSCDACSKKIKGYHYRCLCSYVKRNLHPWCIAGHKQTLEAADGLTLRLQKEATTRCFHCRNKKLSYKVPGWAYVSSCGNYCYHISCVMEIINKHWNNGFFTGKSDPFMTIKDRFPEDKDKMHHLVAAEKERSNWKRFFAVLSTLFHALTGNPLGLIGASKLFFG